MKIYGYTLDKEIVAVDLGINKIVAAGIDPWRLDLFDPDPICLRVSGKKLYFRRLRDLCLAYKTAPSQVLVGVHDGSNAACFAGEPGWLESGSLKLHNIKHQPIDFGKFLRTYLTLLSQPAATNRSVMESWFVKTLSPQEQEELFAGAVLPPLAAQAAQIQGNALNLKLPLKLEKFQFVGKMFCERRAAFQLPHQINWVFEQFAQWQPIVRFEALTLFGAKPTCIHIFLDQAGLTEIEKRFGGTASSVISFDANGSFYSAWSKSETFIPGTLGHSGSVYDWSQYALSVTDAHSSTANEVVLSRISFFDMARRQARYQLYCPFSSQEFGSQQAQALWKRGFTIVDGPWTERRKLPLIYRMLNWSVALAHNLLSNRFSN